MYIVEVDGANFWPSSPHNLVVYGYIVHMYVYLDRLFSWSSNTLVKLSMPAWPTFMWVMNDSKPIFQSEIKMLSQHGYNMAAWLWKNIRNADRGLIDRGAINKRCLHFFQIFWPTPSTCSLWLLFGTFILNLFETNLNFRNKINDWVRNKK